MKNQGIEEILGFIGTHNVFSDGRIIETPHFCRIK